MFQDTHQEAPPEENTYHCRFCGKSNQAPQGNAAHERNCPKNPNYVVPKNMQARMDREAAKAENPLNLCPECKAEGLERSFETFGALSSHRFRAHNIESLSAKVNKNKRRKDKPQSRKTAAKSGEPDSLTVVVNNNGEPTAASLRQTMRVEANNRQDLLAVIKVVYPKGVPTTDDAALDQFVGFVFNTAEMLADR